MKSNNPAKRYQTRLRSMGRRKIKKPKQDKLSWLNEETIKPYLSMSVSFPIFLKYFQQDQAAELLNVSISTLKRKFYTLNIGRWPTIRKFHSKSFSSKKKKIEFILNKQDVNEKHLSNQTMDTLQGIANQNHNYLSRYLLRPINWKE